MICRPVIEPDVSPLPGIIDEFCITRANEWFWQSRRSKEMMPTIFWTYG